LMNTVLRRLFGARKKDDRPLVAVIEDEQDLCEMIRLALDPGGYAVQTASDGVAGLDLIRSQRPALVILDIMMPRMNGYEMLAKVHQDPELAKMPVIVLTSVTEDGTEKTDEEWAKSLGVSLFISKPCDPTKIAEAVDSLLKPADQAETGSSVTAP